MPGAFRDAPRASLITYRLIGTSIQPPLQKDPDYPFKEAVSSQLYIEIRKCNHENTKEREFNWLYSVIPPMERGGATEMASVHSCFCLTVSLLFVAVVFLCSCDSFLEQFKQGGGIYNAIHTPKLYREQAIF